MRPATRRSASSTSVLPSISSVLESSTVTGAPIREGNTSVAAEVTDTLSSSGPIGSASSIETRAPRPTKIGSVVRARNPGELASTW